MRIAIACLAFLISAPAHAESKMEALAKGMGAVTMMMKCPDVQQNFPETDRLFGEAKRSGTDFDDEPYNTIWLKAATDGEKRVKDGDVVGYCLEMMRDYGPSGALWPDLAAERRR